MKRCCVVITYFEAGAALLRSLDSLDSSDLLDVVVVDDGSTRLPAARELAGYDSDLDIRLIELPTNRGVENAANAGLEAARDYELIARLDCGDVCVDGRIARQVAFLDKHPDCALVGSWVTFVDVTGRPLYTVRQPADHEAIRRGMFVNCVITQPSAMFRSKVLDEVGLYPTNRPAAEDFGLFLAITERCRVANIPEPLVLCVVDPNGISTLRRREQLRSRIALLVQHFEPRPIAVYGILRAAAQLATPRSVTVWVNSWRDRLRQRLPSPARRPL